MSKTRQQRSAQKSRRNCRRKAWYPRESVARGVGQAVLERTKSDGRLWPYMCQHCSLWRLTSHPGDLTNTAPITAKSAGVFVEGAAW